MSGSNVLVGEGPSPARLDDGTAKSLLRISDLVVRYGTVTALRGIDLSVDVGEIVAIVGPNGAGKTSLLSAIAGVVRAASGRIAIDGVELDGLIEDCVRRGIALVPEGRHVFGRLTVLENLKLGATLRRGSVAREIETFLEAFPILGQRRHQAAGLMSGGEQQQLVIARALLSRPKLLLLDEPSLGLAPLIVEDVYALIRNVRAQGTTIIVVEQSATRALAVADKTFVLNAGMFRLSGTGEELGRHPDFEAAYFGLDGAREEAGP